ncbi:hypothetical protein BJ875DRAFT_513972 [Amylocarpus encephaloides]|uniref:Xylanolytic transcriptional activator regulatory domain-containing protein n=1 Tax=Amylocarpus encephaloides TaxID=45428 RepID=A0A9P8C8U7_9HELO|nr:hypothetical protein BJ875DRAFT_513972 [Amylocarpus encephaloides]
MSISDISIPVLQGSDAGKAKPGPALRQSICSACRERNIECSYRVGGPKGRPRGPSRASTEDTSIKSGVSTPSTDSLQWRGGSPVKNAYLDGSNPDVPDRSVATNLQSMFNRLMGDRSESTTHHSNLVLDNFNKQIPRAGRPAKCGGSPQSPMPTSIGKPISYEGLFFILAQELIEMIALRFGDLGCHQLEAGRSRYFVKSFMADTVECMFDRVESFPSTDKGNSPPSGFGQPLTPGSTPLQEYNGHLTVQMLEIWFSQHPLSFIFPKTLLLRDIRHDTHDEILLAAILADVQYAQDNEESRNKGSKLFRWAAAKLREVSQNNIRLSTIQAVILLGWRSLCSGNARRAMCYFVWAGYAIHSLPTPPLGVNTINGIDVGEIERESLCNAHWLIFSVNLWAMMQMDAPGCEMPPSSAPSSFPPVDESASASFKLDRTSYNFSTLQNQERMFRELWLLSHVAATTSHIYALYPRSLPQEDISDPGCWQQSTLEQLRRLSSPTTDISMLCTRVRRVLLDSVQLVETHVQHSHSQALALSASHTMIIHFLVPSPASSTNGNSYAGSMSRVFAAGGIDQLIVDFCYSATSLLKVFSVLDNADREGAHSDRVVMSQRPSSIYDIFALALDACGRGMNSIYLLGQNGSELERKCVRDRTGELYRLATELHAFSKELNLVSTTRLKTVKKQLKNAITQFGSLHMGLSSSYGSTSTSSCGSMGIPDSAITTGFDGDFFGLDHLSDTSSTRMGGGFYGYGLPVLTDDAYSADGGLGYFLDAQAQADGLQNFNAPMPSDSGSAPYRMDSMME